MKNEHEYIGKKFLLITKLKDKLFYTDDGFFIEIEINNQGEFSAYKISKKMKRIQFDSSLKKIGEEYLGFKNPSASEILNYFILPEMEVERIFNNLRFKYLNAIYLSGFEDPQKIISADYNNAFKALAGKKVYQGPILERKDNDYIWKSAGFKEKAKIENNFHIEVEEFNFIISYIRNSNLNNINKIYAELIAIKPGFHEIWIHNDYFNDDYSKEAQNLEKDKIREKIFRLLRGFGSLTDIKLTKLPREINKQSYFTYAACNVTEGPFVFRKNISFSYFDEIRKIRSKKDLQNLANTFFILDYHQNNLNSLEKLNKFLIEAKKFRNFIHINN